MEGQFTEFLEEFDEVHIEPLNYKNSNSSISTSGTSEIIGEAEIVSFDETPIVNPNMEFNNNQLPELYNSKVPVVSHNAADKVGDFANNLNDTVYNGFSKLVFKTRKFVNSVITTVNASQNIKLFEKGELVIAGDFQFLKAEKQLMLIKYIGTENHVIIPDKVGGLPVTFIKSCTFRKGRFVTSTKIKNVLRTLKQDNIKVQTFDKVANASKGVLSVQLPIHLKSIPKDLFDHCPNLHVIEIPAEVESIDQNAFRDCNIKSIYFSNPPTKDMKYLKISKDVNIFVKRVYYEQYLEVFSNE